MRLSVKSYPKAALEAATKTNEALLRAVPKAHRQRCKMPGAPGPALGTWERLLYPTALLERTH
jgi:hypothetical protein